MSIPTFVVGTGRCGSTMLSNMLREHPKVLSLSEFFSMITDGDQTHEPFSSEPMDGGRFWSIMAATGRYYSFTLQHGLEFPEILYPVANPSTRFSSQTGVPGILLTSLPHLTAEHDALFDRLGDEVSAWPHAPIADHYQRLFGWLVDYFGKRQWVERSGALRYVGWFQQMFPDARFVHIVRDGRDAALSMQKHNAWRLGLAWYWIEEFLGVNPFESADRTHVDRVPAGLRRFLPDQFNADAFREFEIPLLSCGGFWASEITAGLDLIRQFPNTRVLTLRYEDFLTDPKHQLDTLAAFLGEECVDEDWSARCAATVRPPRSSWRDLHEEEASALTEACRPGFELLREARVEYEF